MRSLLTVLTSGLLSTRKGVVPTSTLTFRGNMKLVTIFITFFAAILFNSLQSPYTEIFTPLPTIEVVEQRSTVPDPQQTAKEEKLTIQPAVHVRAVQASGSCADEVHKYDWPIDTALAVMQQESSGDPGNHNFSHATRDDSWGCFQINIYPPNHLTRPSSDWLVNATNNVSYAYDMYVAQGRTFCKTSGWYNTCKKLGII